MLKTTPFLLFDGDCAEAMTFYHKCLGGELTLTKLGDSPMKDMLPPEKHSRIINAHLKSGEIDISAADWMASPAYNPILGNMFSIFVTGKNYDEMKVVFYKLAEGADKADKMLFQELHDLPFGVYGQFHNKYGIPWIFVVEKKE